MILLGSLSTGIVSCLVAYNLASSSLQSVKSPEENPAQKLSIKNSSNGFKIMKEKDILVQVYNYVYTQKKAKAKT